MGIKANRQKGLKKLGNKKVQGYVPEALASLGKALELLRRPKKGVVGVPILRVDLKGLETALKAIPKKEREIIEKFWGLNGGTNHSKKISCYLGNDVAYINMRNTAVVALRTLLQLDYMILYDNHLGLVIEKIASKINRDEEKVSDLESAKYLMAFIMFVCNGPKMDFEDDPMTIDTDCNENASFDEYMMLEEIYTAIHNIPDGSINFQLLLNFFEMLDVKDAIAIKNSVGIEIPTEWRNEEIEELRTIAQLRRFKERVFPYGAWNVTSGLIFGNYENRIKLDEFAKSINVIRKDWSKILNFKSSEQTLKISSEVRTLNVYNIGGLEFTDAYEVMFLYLERNLLWKDQ